MILDIFSNTRTTFLYRFMGISISLAQSVCFQMCLESLIFGLTLRYITWFNRSVMSRVCEICGKEYMKGNLVPRGIGKRVTKRTIRRQLPNLRSQKIEINGRKVRVKLCASCLKRLKFERIHAENPPTK